MRRHPPAPNEFYALRHPCHRQPEASTIQSVHFSYAPVQFVRCFTDDATIDMQLYIGRCDGGLVKPYQLSTWCPASSCTRSELKFLSGKAGHTLTPTLTLRRSSQRGEYEGLMDVRMLCPHVAQL